MSVPELTPELVLRAYAMGIFPMACSRRGPIEWYSPNPRAVLPLEEGVFRVRRSLRKRIRSGRFRITHDRVFEQVIRACAKPRPATPDTWISQEIIEVFSQLHERGIAHSVEAWMSEPGQDTSQTAPSLAGGLYGVALGGAFFGESMFTRATDASKVCLVHLVEHLREQGFTLLDVQFANPHLEQFGILEIPRDEYLRRLHDALMQPVTW